MSQNAIKATVNQIQINELNGSRLIKPKFIEDVLQDHELHRIQCPSCGKKFSTLRFMAEVFETMFQTLALGQAIHMRNFGVLYRSVRFRGQARNVDERPFDFSVKFHLGRLLTRRFNGANLIPLKLKQRFFHIRARTLEMFRSRELPFSQITSDPQGKLNKLQIAQNKQHLTLNTEQKAKNK